MNKLMRASKTERGPTLGQTCSESGFRCITIRRGWLLAAVLVVALAIGVSPAQAQYLAMAYPSFTAANSAGLVLDGGHANYGVRLDPPFVAYIPSDTPVVRLTDAVSDEAGSVFSSQRVRLSADRSFSAFFSLRIHSDHPSNSADGMMWVLQGGTTTPLVPGGGLGFLGNGGNGLGKSLGIEFDTFQNAWDPNSNHVGLDLNGNQQSVVTATPPGNASLNGDPWNVWVDYEGLAKVLQLRMSQTTTRPATPTLSYSIDLATVIPQDVCSGFTAATGGLSEVHDLQSMYLENSYLSGGITPATTHYSTAPDASSASSGPPEPGVSNARGQINGEVTAEAQLSLTISGTDLHYGTSGQGATGVREINGTRTVLTNAGDVQSGLFIQGDGPASALERNGHWTMSSTAGQDAFAWRFANADGATYDVVTAAATDLGTLGFADSRDLSSVIDMPTYTSEAGTYRWSATVWVTDPS